MHAQAEYEHQRYFQSLSPPLEAATTFRLAILQKDEKGLKNKETRDAQSDEMDSTITFDTQGGRWGA